MNKIEKDVENEEFENKRKEDLDKLIKYIKKNGNESIKKIFKEEKIDILRKNEQKNCGDYFSESETISLNQSTNNTINSTPTTTSSDANNKKKNRRKDKGRSKSNGDMSKLKKFGRW